MKLSKVFVFTALVVVLAFGAWGVSKYGASGAAASAKSGTDKGVPVRVSLAERKATGVYLDSIATVQAFNTVAVRARVDGQIERIRFTEGSAVKRGDVIAELDRRPFEVQLRAALAQKAKDAAQLVNAARNLERNEELVKHAAIAPQALDAARASYDQLRATVDADQAQIDQAQLQLDYTVIRSPIAGRAGARLVDAGNLVHAGDAGGVVTISQIHPVSVSFALPQTMLSALREQQARHPLAVTALAADGGVIEQGKLSLIDSQVDTATGTIHCKATFDNGKEALWPGAFITVRVQLDTLPEAVTVPSSAIQPGNRHAFVYIVNRDNLVEVKEVSAGPVSGERTVVLAGLAGGERVIVEGQFQVEAGKRVEPLPAVATPSSAHP